nr:GTP-binding protein [Pseudomonas sp. RW10S2]
MLTGFLGSGKTTILNHLVQQPELATALVIINEFGAVALDHRLVAHSTDHVVMEMSSGCLCCTIRGDLIDTLRDIHWRFSREGLRQYDRVLIETTGLADPAPIIHTLMTQPEVATRYRLDGVVTALDLATGWETLDRQTEAVRQAAMADVLLLTKGDLIAPERRSELEQRLKAINPAAPRYDVRDGVVAPDLLLDLGFYAVEGKTPNVRRWLREEAYADERPVKGDTHASDHYHGQGADHAHHHGHGPHHEHDVNRHDDQIRAFCFSLNEPIPEVVLAAWLEMLLRFVGSDILRVKGILHIEGHDRPFVIQGVQHIFHPPISLPAWPDEDRRSRVVFITRGVERQAIEETFDAFRQAVPQAWEVET